MSVYIYISNKYTSLNKDMRVIRVLHILRRAVSYKIMIT